MGVGITTLAVAHGLPVTLVDVDATKLASAAGRVRGQLRMAALMGGAPADRVAAIEVTTSLDDLVGVTAGIEAGPEIARLEGEGGARGTGGGRAGGPRGGPTPPRP